MAKARKVFDAATKHLLEVRPDSWLELIGHRPSGGARLIDADLATVTTEADKVVRVDGPEPWIAHFEFQASRDPGLPRRLLRYNILLDSRHDLPVHSAIILLRPKADGPELGGALERRSPLGSCAIGFTYQVLRPWLLPAETFLTGGLGTLPLAPLADVESLDLPEVLRRVGRRLAEEAEPAEVADLWVATGLLAGLAHPKDYALTLVRRISAMFLGIKGLEESWFYQDILTEGEARGRAEGALAMLLRVGTRRLGTPPVGVAEAIAAMVEAGRTDEMTDRLLTASNWEELIEAPAGPPDRDKRPGT